MPGMATIGFEQAMQLYADLGKFLFYIEVLVEDRAVTPPSGHDKPRLGRYLQEVVHIILAHRVSLRLYCFRVGCSKSEQVGHAHRAKAPPLSEPAANPNRGVIFGFVCG